MAHGGLGVTFIGVALMLAWNVEDIRVAKVGETFTVGGYDITLADVEDGQGPNYFYTRATMEVAQGGRLLAEMFPEKRFYPVARMPTTEAAIRQGVFRDIYLVIGDKQADGGWAVRSYIKPFANWVWAGAILMGLGGLVSLTDRRFRGSGRTQGVTSCCGPGRVDANAVDHRGTDAVADGTGIGRAAG